MRQRTARMTGIVFVAATLTLSNTSIVSADTAKYPEQALLAAAKRGITETIGELVARGVDIEARDRDGKTALMLAADRGHIESVRELLKAGAEVDARDRKGNTALLNAVGKIFGEVVDALIEAGADPNLRGSGGETALIRASGRVEYVRKLIAAGADVNLQNEYGETALTHLQRLAPVGSEETLTVLREAGAEVSPEYAFILAAKRGETDRVKASIESGIDVNATDQHGRTALMRAAERPRSGPVQDRDQHCLEVARDLLQAGADVDAVDLDGRNALSFATQTKFSKMIEALKSAGAVLPPDEALRWAAAEQDLETVETLIREGVDVNGRDRSGRTALHIAARHDLPQLTQALLAAGADANAADDEGRTPLHAAANSEILRVLLAAGADPNRGDILGRTALFEAAESGSSDQVSDLLAAGAEVNATTGDGNSPLHEAAWNGRGAVVSMLLEAGAETNAETAFGMTPLKLALRKGHQEVVEALRAAGGGLSDEDALRQAAKEGDLETVRELLAGNVDPNAQALGDTSLHLAAAMGHAEVVRELLRAGADLEARDPVQGTPLIRAALAGRVEAVRELARAGADLEATSEQGVTALFWAVFYGYPAVVRELLQAGASVTPRDRAAAMDKPLIRQILADQTSKAGAASDAAAAGPEEAVRVWLEVAAKAKPVEALDAVMDWAAIARQLATEEPRAKGMPPEAVATMFKLRAEQRPPALTVEQIEAMMMMMSTKVEGTSATVRLLNELGAFRLTKGEDGTWRITSQD